MRAIVEGAGISSGISSIRRSRRLGKSWTWRWFLMEMQKNILMVVNGASLASTGLKNVSETWLKPVPYRFCRMWPHTSPLFTVLRWILRAVIRALLLRDAPASKESILLPLTSARAVPRGIPSSMKWLWKRTRWILVIITFHGWHWTVNTLKIFRRKPRLIYWDWYAILTKAVNLLRVEKTCLSITAATWMRDWTNSLAKKNALQEGLNQLVTLL